MKNQVNAKQNLRLNLFENYSQSSSTLSSKNKQKNKSVYVFMILMKNKSHRYDINRYRSRRGHKCSNNKVSQYDDAYMY